MYKPISDYGVIGDMHSAALVAADGSIDWLCFPRFDSPSVFAALLDDQKGGRFRLSPAGAFQSDQQYLPESNVLITEFSARSGSAGLTDFMPVSQDVTESVHQVVRLVRCHSGTIDLELEFQPRLDYARGETQLSVSGQAAIARKGDDCLSLAANVPLEANGDSAHARFRMSAGQTAAFVLS